MQRMSPESRERRQRLWAGLLCGALGLFLVYSVWSRQPGWLVPPLVGYLAAGSFLAAGAALLLQAGGYFGLAMFPAFLLVAALAGIGGWVGFGPGSRRCEGDFGVMHFLPGELVCRAVFGTGAVLTGLIALLMLGQLLRGGSKEPHA
jgi:hypothetical protein